MKEVKPISKIPAKIKAIQACIKNPLVINVTFVTLITRGKMARSVDPHIKLALLNKCLEVAIKKGSIALSIHEFGKLTKSSARMLIYHFGSKAELDERITMHLDETIRVEFVRFFAETGSDENLLLKLWDFMTTNARFKSLAIFSMNLVVGPKVKASTRRAMEEQTSAWIEVFAEHFESRESAETAVLLVQGALIDFLTTGNEVRGRRCLEKFLHTANRSGA